MRANFPGHSGARSYANPESITPILSARFPSVFLDSGLARRRAPRNDRHHSSSVTLTWARDTQGVMRSWRLAKGRMTSRWITLPLR